MKIRQVSLIYLFGMVACIVTKPQHEDDSEPQARIHKKKGGGRPGGRPCVTFPRPSKGRTFLDWNFQYIDVSYNYHYTVNCGGNGDSGGIGHHQGGGGGGFNKPTGTGLIASLGNKGQALLGVTNLLLGGLNNQFVPVAPQGPAYPIINNRPPINGPPAGGVSTQTQTQTQSIGASGGLLNGQGIQGITSLLPSLPALPQNGLFNGQLVQGISDGISSIFNRPNGDGVVSSGSQSTSGGGQNFLGGLLGFFNRPGSSSSSSSSSSGGNPTGIPTTTIDPGDIIYNDKPVHEDHDEVTEAYSNLRPDFLGRKLGLRNDTKRWQIRRSLIWNSSYYNRYPAGYNVYNGGYYNRRPNNNNLYSNDYYNHKFIGQQNYDRRYRTILKK